MPYVFMPPKENGLANQLITLTDFFFHHPDGLVHESIRDNEIGEWLDFNFETTARTDLPQYKGNIFINEFTMKNVHPLIRKLVKPSAKLQKVIARHEHLIQNVNLGCHVRRGASAIDSRPFVENDTDTFASDEAVQKMIEMVKSVGPDPVFLASDSPQTKKLFPENVKTLDAEIAVVHDMVKSDPKNRVNIFVDFFLLSKCPNIIVTGGNFPKLPGLSTFGYMAAVYGGAQAIIVPNP